MCKIWKSSHSFTGNGSLANSRRRAAAAVELAVVLPLLVTLTLAAIDFGRIVQAYIIVSHGARAGVGYAASHRYSSFTQSSWQTKIRQVVDAELQGLSGYSSGSLQVAITTTTESTDHTRVAVQVSYPFVTIVDWVGIPANVLLTRRVEMRQYR